MNEPKRISDITVEDLQSHQWCVYHNDEEGFDCFEHVIPDSHPEFSEDIVQLELAEFSFANGKVQFGSFDGSESFVLFADGIRYYFWHGIRQPDRSELDRFSRFLTANELQLPVVARAKWSETERTFRGFQFIDSRGERREIAI